MTSAPRNPDWGGSSGGGPDAIPAIGTGGDFAITGNLYVLGGRPWVDVRAKGALGAGNDDTQAIQNAATAAAGGVLFFPADTYLADGITIPANTYVLARGAKLKGRAGTTAVVLTLSSGCTLEGLEVDGNKTNRASSTYAVSSSHIATDIAILNCYIHDAKTRGIELDTVTRFNLSGNRIEDCGAQGIELDYCFSGQVLGNRVKNCQHGIQVWGGDAAVSSVIGSSDIAVFGNVVDTTTTGAGIWGSLVERFAITGNTVKSIADVGIDFEGCIHSSASGNTVTDATNGGISFFYASSHIAITGNQVRQTGAQRGIYIAGAASTAATWINIVGNEIRVNTGSGIYGDTSALSNSEIKDNLVHVTGTAKGIRIQSGNRVNLIGNRVYIAGTGAGLTAIALEGPSDCLVLNNYCEAANDTAVAIGDYGGILNYWVSGSFPAKRNTFRGNLCTGFYSGINDDCWGDVTSKAWIDSNRTNTIHRRTGGGWDGLTANNVILSNPNTPTTVTAY